MSDRPADLLELFSSIQGEGLLVGLRQIFLRFYGCNLACDYCDTKLVSPPPHCTMEGTPGRRDYIQEKNPVSLERIMSHLSGWQRGWPGIHHSISITGGEPLFSHEILLKWLPELRTLFPIYLETNGVLFTELSRLIDHIDHISMDIKLPSSSGCTDLWTHHLNFLRIAARKHTFVKVVINDETEDWEVIKACEIIGEVDSKIPLILQPVTLSTGTVGITPLKMLELQEIACGYLQEVRIIPQTHRFMGHL